MKCKGLCNNLAYNQCDSGKLIVENLQSRIMTIHICMQENETCPTTKPEKKYSNRNEREFPAQNSADQTDQSEMKKTK